MRLILVKQTKPHPEVPPHFAAASKAGREYGASAGTYAAAGAWRRVMMTTKIAAVMNITRL